MTGGGLQARVCGIGLVAPGIADWQAGSQVLAGREPWQPGSLAVPAANLLPPAERRRVGKAIRLALACGHQAITNAGQDPAGVASVFASADVDAENTHQICLALNEPAPALSPIRFHNSVQNAVSGYWTIATGSRLPTTMVMGGDEVLAMGLLEAMTQAVAAPHPVLLVVFDVPMPAPLFATHPIAQGGAVAMVLDANAREGPALAVSLVKREGARSCGVGATGANDAVGLNDAPGTDGCRVPVPASLAGLRQMHPVGPALPMLAMLSRAVCGHARLAFDRYHDLQIAVEP